MKKERKRKRKSKSSNPKGACDKNSYKTYLNAQEEILLSTHVFVNPHQYMLNISLNH